MADLGNVFKKLQWDNRRIKTDGEYLNNHRLADGIYLPNESEENIKRLV